MCFSKGDNNFCLPLYFLLSCRALNAADIRDYVIHITIVPLETSSSSEKNAIRHVYARSKAQCIFS
jgi:hypothetical protein